MGQDVHPHSGRKNVNSRLDQVKDWPGVAKEARFQLQQMARILAVSARQLRRYIWERFEKRAKRWLDEMRAEAAKEDFERGELVKTTSDDVCFAHACNFSRFYKRVTGSTPQNARHKKAMSGIDTKGPQKVRDVRFR